MLGDERGKLVPFGDPQAMSSAISDLFDNEIERHAMRKRAYQYTRQMVWSSVAQQYLDVFAEVREQRANNPKPNVLRLVKSRAKQGGDDELPEIKIDHLLTLTDDTGIFASARTTVPDRAAGYTTEDNARALIAVLQAQDDLDYTAGKSLDVLVRRYLSFINHAYNEQTGRFRSRLSFDRRWEDDKASEDGHALAMWALGEAVARSQLRGHLPLAARLFQQGLAACESITFLSVLY